MAALATGCTREPETVVESVPEPMEIIVEPAELRLAAGSQAALSAQANDDAGQPVGGAPIRFTAPDSQLLNVSDRGIVSALGPVGRSAIIVSSGRLERRVAVEIEAGPLERIEKAAGDGQRVLAGQAPAEPLAVRVSDAWANPLAGVALVLEAPEEPALEAEAVSGDDGLASFQLPAQTRARSLRLTVRPRNGARPAETFDLEVQPAAPAAVEIVCAARSAEPARATGIDIVLRVRDEHGNPVPDVPLVARLDPGKQPPAPFRTDALGTAHLSLPRPPGTAAPALEVLSDDTRLGGARLSLRDDPCGDAPAAQVPAT